MPLVRVEVRNEYGLGLPELYKEANKEDPKAVLEGVAVAGLVGILRQLGDLAEFAAEVFHGLQEQVMNISSRSHRLMVRVRHIEAALPPLEKAMLAQKSHLHFAYTTGSNWHARVRTEQNHFIYNDLPRFIMDSYEECRGPPRLHLLDKFDSSGPGSCLKRYSDPTFFRRALTKSDEANAEKVPRDKKARRIKKKRLWQRNGEASHGASISSYGGRTQFASLNVDEKTSPSQTVSTFDARLKSDMGDPSNSFDSRNDSGYVECVFHPSYSMQPEEHESKESPSTESKLHHNDTFDYAFLNEKIGVVDDDIHDNLSPEQIGPSSSCVTWDEKTEIVDRTGQHHDHDDSPEMIPTNFDSDSQEMEVVNFGTFDQRDFGFDNENVPSLGSFSNQLDDIESEPENYMDALNTIDSESETDIDCQTKRALEQYSNLNNKAIEDGKHMLKAENSDHHPSNYESQTGDDSSINRSTSGYNQNSVSPETHSVACSSSNKETSDDIPDSVSLECYGNTHSPKMAGKSSNSESLQDIDLCESGDILDGLNVESVVSKVLSSGSREPNSQAPVSDEIINIPHEPQKPLPEPSSTSSINFWTNGGLLGLAPSKPPDYSLLNAVHQDSVALGKHDTVGLPSQSNILEGDGGAGNQVKLIKTSEIVGQGPDSKCPGSDSGDQEYSVSLRKTSSRPLPTSLDIKLEKSSDIFKKKNCNHSQGLDFDKTSIATPSTAQPVSPDVQATKTSQGDGKSSGIFEFSNRFVNGFRRKPSLGGDDNSDTASSYNAGVFEQKSGHQTVTYPTFSGRTKEQFGRGSPVMSPSSSPPLEHMKIPFQPIDSFETSKLKLKFPDASSCRGSSGDAFHSFQLVPEPAIPLHDIGSESDDDTFCRSSPYMSDDHLSHYSDSNSEQWESDESPHINDNELYDALCRISLTESVSSSLEIRGTTRGGIHDNCELQNQFSENAVGLSQCGRLPDLPSFDTLKPSFKEELKNDFDAKELLESHVPKELTPMIPPLPPLQWRTTKSHSDVVADTQDALPEALNYAFNLNLSGSTVSQQPKPAPVKEDQNIESASTLKSKLECQKLNGLKDSNQATTGKGMDEKEDFLHQIRTKSFSLRRTATERPTITPGPTTNVKVTAILEKANAIRQVVGSDDGEDDDNWSDN